MISFWLVAGLLIAGALLFVLPPLLGRRPISGGASHALANINIYRDQLRELDLDLAQGSIDQAHYETARREIEKRVLEEGIDLEDTPAPAQAQWTLVSVIGVLLPVMAIGVYLAVGSPAALTGQAAQAQQGDQGHPVSAEQIEAMVAGLAERLKQEPENGEGWHMLARSYAAMGRFADAAKAYQEAARHLPPDAQLLADYADALAMAQGRTLIGEPEKLIAQALKVDPDNVKALALLGSAAFAKQDYRGAVAAWERLLKVLPPESELAQRMQASLQDARSRAGTPVGASKAVAAATIAGRVSLSAEAQKMVAPGDTVFVFARAAQGPRMPVAIFRTQVSALPVEFVLDESMNLMGGQRLSEAGELVVGARVSRTGSATPSAGDWESALVPARPGAKGITLSVDRPYKG